MTPSKTRAQAIRMDATGPELECRWCGEFWPLTLDHWAVRGKDGRLRTDRCRSCESERGKLRHAMMRIDPDYMEAQRQRSRRYRSLIMRTAPHLVAAYERERKAISRRASYIAKYGEERAA